MTSNLLRPYSGILTAVALAAVTLVAHSQTGDSVPSGATAAAPAASARPASPATARAASSTATPTLRPCTSVAVDQPTNLSLGKSRVVRLDFPAARVIVGGHGGGRSGRPAEAAPQGNAGRGAGAGPTPGTPGQAGGGAAGGRDSGSDGVADTDVTLLSPTELFFLGRRTGSMNVIVQGTDGRCLVKDIVVTIDPETIQGKLTELIPDESGVKVRSAENAIVLTGSVTDAVKLDQIMTLASAYGDGRRVVNMMRVTAPQQVMLEVKIAEVSKTLLDRFGIDFTRAVTTADGVRTSVFSGLLGARPGVFGRFNPNVAGGNIIGNAGSSVSSEIAGASAAVNSTARGASLLGLDMQSQDGVIRVLAEPNIMAISGQSASFLSGGKIFIPVAQNRDAGGTTITLEEKEFGVGLKFTPTVLDGRISLKVQSEVSELSQSGTPFATMGGVTAVLPSMSTRKVDTTVQLGDGQSFVVAGLIKSNVTQALDKFPGLGEAPVVGALFRSTEFQNDKTELMFVVTPRLVKPLQAPPVLPTDVHVSPDRNDVILRGTGEGPQRSPTPAPSGQPLPPPTAPQQPSTRP